MPKAPSLRSPELPPKPPAPSSVSQKLTSGRNPAPPKPTSKRRSITSKPAAQRRSVSPQPTTSRNQQPATPTAPSSPSLAPQPSLGEALGPTSDLVTLAGRIPAELLQQLDTAIQSGHWLFAVWHVANGRIELKRTATDFPTIDLDLAVKLLADDLHNLKSA